MTATSKRRYRSRSKLSFGPRGWETLKLAFQVGGFTVHQHARFFSMTRTSSYRILSSLARQGLMETGPVQTPGRPRDFYFLSTKNAARGVILGGHESGLFEKRAKAQYRLHQLPATVEHAHARNEFLLRLRESAAERAMAGEEAEAPLWEMHGESYRGFPWSVVKGGPGEPHEKVYPDGVFEIRFSWGLTGRYIIEYESRSRPEHVLAKLDRYGAYYRRRLREDGAGEWLMPVIFLYRRNSTAAHAAGAVLVALEEEATGLSRFLKWREAALKKGIHAGRLVLFASLEDLEVHDALGMRYGVVELYPEGFAGISRDRSRVELEAVAEEVAEALAPDEEEAQS